jgi:hypothetical protein
MRPSIEVGKRVRLYTNHRGTVAKFVCWRVKDDGGRQMGLFCRRAWFEDGMKRIEHWFEWKK